MDSKERYNDVVCIGTGMAGICLGVQLQRKYGFEDYHMYDRNESFSGTWWANRYPGAACDIPAHFYSFSFEPNGTWSRLLTPSTEITSYLSKVVAKYSMVSRMTFRTEVESAVWSSVRQRWVLSLLDLESGERYVHECKVLFSGVGVLVDPSYPKFDGADKFEGIAMHTARWRSDVDLKDKNVVLIGNGCSATQTMPAIAPLPKSLTQIIRQPHWLVHHPNAVFPASVRWVLSHCPPVLQTLRTMIFLNSEFNWLMFYLNPFAAWLRKRNSKQSMDYIHREAPKEYWELLTPKIEFSCKRRIFDSTYFAALNLPNVQLTKDPITRISAHEVHTSTRSYPCDVLIYATGFQTNNGLGKLKIQGKDGVRLDEKWARKGGPGAYNTTSVHGFPNFFMLFGPNSTTGHTSVVLAIENGVNLALHVLRPVLEGRANTVEVTASAEDKYLARLQKASRDRLWMKCSNWYVSKEGWNSTMYPWSQIHFWYRCAFPTRKDWSYTMSAGAKMRRARRTKILSATAVVVFTLSILASVGQLNSGGSLRWTDVRDVVVDRVYHVARSVMQAVGK